MICGVEGNPGVVVLALNFYHKLAHHTLLLEKEYPVVRMGILSHRAKGRLGTRAKLYWS